VLSDAFVVKWVPDKEIANKGEFVIQICNIEVLADKVSGAHLIERDPTYRRLGISNKNDYELLLSQVNQQLRLCTDKADFVKQSRFIPAELKTIGQALLAQVNLTETLEDPVSPDPLTNLPAFSVDVLQGSEYTDYKSWLSDKFSPQEGQPQVHQPLRYTKEQSKHTALGELEQASTAGTLTLRTLDCIEAKYKNQGLYSSFLPSTMKKWRNKVEQDIKEKHPLYVYFYQEWKQLQEQRSKGDVFSANDTLWQQFVYGMLNGLEQGWIKKTNDHGLFHEKPDIIERLMNEDAVELSDSQKLLYQGAVMRQPKDYLYTIMPLVNDTCAKLAENRRGHNAMVVPSFITEDRFYSLTAAWNRADPLPQASAAAQMESW